MPESIPPSPYENLPEGQITFSQAAAALGVKKSKIESLVKQGTFPTVVPEEYHLPRRLLLDEVEQLKYSGHVKRAGLIAAAMTESVPATLRDLTPLGTGSDSAGAA